MSKSVFICLFILLFYRLGIAQQINITEKAYRDSLKLELFIAEQDTTTVQLLNSLADSYWISKYDSGIFYAKNALLIARKNNYDHGEINSLLTLALVSSVIGDFVKGYEYSSMAISLSKKLGNQQLLRKAYSAYGEVLASSEKYSDAIYAIKMAVEVKSDDEFQLMLNYAQLSDWYEKIGQPDSANFFAKKAYVTIVNERYSSPYPLRVIAKMHARSNEKKQALQFYKRSIESAIKYRDDISLTMAYLDMSRLYAKANQGDSAFHFAEKALQNAEKSRSVIFIIEANNNLLELYSPIDAEMALQYAMKSNIAKDSLKYIIQEQSIRSFNDFDLKLRELEIEQAKKALNDKIKQNTFLGSIIALSIIAFALYRNNRMKQRGKRKVERAYEKLKTAQDKLIHSEKMASLGEITAGIAHEIQNPLNFVNNFADLNSELLDEIEETMAGGDEIELKQLIEDLKSNEKRIVHHGKRAEEIVNSMLLHSRTGFSEKEETDMNALADECLSLSFHGIRAKDSQFKSTFQTISDPILPKIDVVRQDIGRVLINLINNAFYAVSEKSKVSDKDYVPAVEVMTQCGQDEVIISVKDNGAGIPEEIKVKIFQPFFTTKATGEGTGLGLSLSYDIITKGHGGTIEVDSEVGKGTTFTINIPIT